MARARRGSQARAPSRTAIRPASLARSATRSSAATTARACARTARASPREKKAAHRDDTYWGRPVPGFGDPDARLLLVGLAPAAHGANRTGRVFTGDGSGDFLLRALHANGLRQHPDLAPRRRRPALRDAYILSAVRCAPPDNKPTPAEIARCRATWPPRSPPCPTSASSSRWARSDTTPSWRTSPRPTACGPDRARRSGTAARRRLGGGLPMLLGCYHPSRQNTNTGKLTPPMMRAVFTRARALLASVAREPMTSRR